MNSDPRLESRKGSPGHDSINFEEHKGSTEEGKNKRISMATIAGFTAMFLMIGGIEIYSIDCSWIDCSLSAR